MSAGPSFPSYAVWNPPSAVFPVHYPLALFREIDFFVGDAYRCIPYGGLEVGAILYGRGEPSGVTILAHRPIECEHSRGPSFVLSAADLATLGKQLATPFITVDDETLEVVGWAVSNCRSDLVLTDQEAQIYDEFFPGPRQVALLAKPEKMKATRFGFLARPPRGGILDRTCRDWFILPLSTKGEAKNLREAVEQIPRPPVVPEPSAAPMATAPPQLPPGAGDALPQEPAMAIPPEAVESPEPAPPQVTSWESPRIEVLPALSLDVPSYPPPAEPAPLEPVIGQQVAPASAVAEEDLAATLPEEPGSAEATVPLVPLLEEVPTPEDAPSPATPEPLKPVIQQVAPPPAEAEVDSAPALPEELASAEAAGLLIPRFEEAPLPEPAVAAVSLPTPSVAVPPVQLLDQTTQSEADSEPGLTRERAGLISSTRSDSQPERQIEEISRSRHIRKSPTPVLEVGLGLVILCLLAFAAIWTYLRLQATPIPVNAEVRAGEVVLTWPPEFTLNSGQSSITTWTNGEKATRAILVGEETEGKAIVPAGGADVIFQLRVPHWYQDRTGQIRVLRVVPPPAPVAPSKPVRRVFAGPGTGLAAPTAGRPSPQGTPQ